METRRKPFFPSPFDKVEDGGTLELASSVITWICVCPPFVVAEDKNIFLKKFCPHRSQMVTPLVTTRVMEVFVGSHGDNW